MTNVFSRENASSNRGSLRLRITCEITIPAYIELMILSDPFVKSYSRVSLENE
ncbi:hypothetical protein D3C71_1967680 [compost metagenome]